jgi:hypothetical protein
MQALKALAEMTPSGVTGSAIWNQQMNAITALSKALEQPEHTGIGGCAMCGAAYGDQVIKAQPEQEPVASIYISQSGEREFDDWKCKLPIGRNLLYTTPPAPKREWQGLTDEEFLEACQLAERGNYLLAFQRIQARLKERNT